MEKKTGVKKRGGGRKEGRMEKRGEEGEKKGGGGRKKGEEEGEKRVRRGGREKG